MTRAANRASAAFTQNWGYDRAEQAREAAREAGLEVLEVDQELLDATDDEFRAGRHRRGDRSGHVTSSA
jgi:TRAP-type transport system periplasmic protein